MKKFKITFILLLAFFATHAQNHFLIGTWNYEKIPDHIEIDEQGIKMANEFFKDMNLSFEQNKYTFTIMGKSESGVWNSLGENIYELTSSKGKKLNVEITKINEKQIIFKQQNREWQLIKVDEEANIEVKKNVLDTIKGIEIDKKLLIGKWYYNGQIKNEKENNIILKHSEKEIVNYTFLSNGTFINKAPLEEEFKANWKIDTNNQTLLIESQDQVEYLKVTKLNSKELYIFNPQTNSILKFQK